MKQFVNYLKQKIVQYKILIENFSSLTLFQLINLSIPLITYAYLIRVLGIEKYGLVVFAQAVVGYLLIFVQFGFNISATKEISIYRDNKKKLSEIVSSVLIIKTILFVISLIVLICILYFMPEIEGYKLLFFLSMWICLYDLIFPVWYFQGIEKMKYIAYVTLVSRLIFVSLIFFLIKSPSDYLLVPTINGIGALVAGAYSLFIIFNSHKIKFQLQSTEKLLFFFKDSIPLFISNISVKLYLSSNKVIIGSFLGMSEISYYDLGEKIVSAMKIPQNILGQTLFPKINKDRNILFVKKVFKLTVLFNVILTLLIIIFSEQIVLVLGGKQLLPSVIVLNILALSVPVIAMSNVFGVQLLIPFGKTKLFSKIIVSSGLIYLIQLLIIWLLGNINIYSLSIITVITEISVTAIMFYFCKKNNLWVMKVES